MFILLHMVSFVCFGLYGVSRQFDNLSSSSGRLVQWGSVALAIPYVIIIVQGILWRLSNG